MLRKLIWTVALLLPMVTLSACDACGCGIGGGGLGLLSVYRNNFVGFNYGILPFRSRLTSGEYTGTEDAFHQLEWQLRYEIFRRLRFDAFVPYRWHLRTGPDGDAALQGLSDIRLGAAYVLADNRPLGSQGNSWYLEAGVVGSLPTGRYEADIFNARNLPDNFNPGRGSFGLGLSSALVVNVRRVGLALNARYLHYGKSTGHFRFGAETMLSAQFFAQFSHDPHWKIIPYLGLGREITQANRTVGNQRVHASGGAAWSLLPGVNVRYDDFTLGLRAGVPLAQQYSDGLAEARPSGNLQLLYNF